MALQISQLDVRARKREREREREKGKEKEKATVTVNSFHVENCDEFSVNRSEPARYNRSSREIIIMNIFHEGLT